ncbi:hypothetical protein DL98DRAFT_578390 [Cadophora sp. DSE1049]|nr:hypothetical protein DL98DRAFT_578390 [Cadophora sp. DSE1049]
MLLRTRGTSSQFMDPRVGGITRAAVYIAVYRNLTRRILPGPEVTLFEEFLESYKETTWGETTLALASITRLLCRCDDLLARKPTEGRASRMHRLKEMSRLRHTAEETIQAMADEISIGTTALLAEFEAKRVKACRDGEPIGCVAIAYFLSLAPLGIAIGVKTLSEEQRSTFTVCAASRQLYKSKVPQRIIFQVHSALLPEQVRLWQSAQITDLYQNPITAV